jgi:hemerythrin superfamily protein
VEILKKDHEEVMKLFEKFEHAPVTEKASIAKQIFKALEVHAVLEEEIFYPAVRDQVNLKEFMQELRDEDMASMKDLIVISYEDHRVVREFIASLRASSPAADEYQEQFADLKEAVQDHIEEEEWMIFPSAEMKIDLEKLGERMRQRKRGLSLPKPPGPPKKQHRRRSTRPDRLLKRPTEKSALHR